MQKFIDYLRLIRPVNCLMMGFAVIVGAALASPNALGVLWQNLVYGFLTGFMLTGASMAINDYHDREIDAINEPNRPIPSGVIKPKEALIFAFALTIIGLVFAYLTSILCLFIAIIAWMVSVTYTTNGKSSGLLGNLLVSACVAIPFIYGSIAIANVVKTSILIFASMVFLSITGREITKGIVDVQGDKTRNVKTLAARFGERTAAVAASIFYLSAVLLSPIPRLLDAVSFWFIPLVAVTNFGFVASSILLLKDYSRENARKIKNTILLWFIFGLAAFLAGALVW